MKCTSCGQELATDDRFCSNCGTPRPVVAELPCIEPAVGRPLAPRFEQAEAGAIAVGPPTPSVSMAVGYFAGFWRRLGAYLVDLVLLIGLYYGLWVFGVINAIAYAMGYVGRRFLGVGAPSPEILTFIGTLVVVGLPLLVDVIYRVGFWTWRGQTLGKMLFGIRIVQADGAPLTFGQAVVRYVASWLSGIPFGLGYWWVAFDSRKQGWHDKIARTIVVRV